MKILVTAKRVTDPEMKIKVKSDGSGIDLTGMNYKVNPFDEIAVEEGLRLKEKNGGEVVIVSIGPSEAKTEIRACLAMGADRGILLTADADLDSTVVAKLLAKVIEEEKPDVVLMGKQSVDNDASQAAQMVAELLGWGQACFASKVEVADSAATVDREIDGGIETLKVQLPAIISADLRLNEPRYASLPGIMKAKRKPIDEKGADSLGVDLAPKVKVLQFSAPPERKGGRLVADVPELIKALKEEAKVL